MSLGLGQPFELFVPGRVCLFGEHADWAGGFRRVNSRIEKGYCIIAGTNQGVYARVCADSSRLIFRFAGPDGSRDELSVRMDAASLLQLAESGGFWSYVAGVAYQALTHYQVGGLVVDNHRTDLPLGKGLSSSAAICVLVARAFNRAYDLKLTTRGEMELAYRGEVTTPSRCGRMDQGCAYGARPTLMVFDGDSLEVSELRVGADLHLVVVDLGATKDTRKILSSLSRAYPFATEPAHGQLQDLLGPKNGGLVRRAIEAIASGSAPELGELMTEAQGEFDRCAAPMCPEQLESPRLHRVLSWPTLKALAYGGKGVGSQGDGSAQLVAKDAGAQLAIVKALDQELGLASLPLTIRRTDAVKKTIITAAGLGTRLYPMTRVVRKELLPTIGRDGLLKPLLLRNMEEIIEAGASSVCVVVQEKERGAFSSLLHDPTPPEVVARLNPEQVAFARLLEDMGKKVVLATQDGQRGLGDAVVSAKEWLGGEPFLLVLGDHLMVSDNEVSCIRQLLDAQGSYGGTMLGLQPTPASEVHRYGVAAGQWIEPNDVLDISHVREKPSADYAREYLRVDGLDTGTFLSFFGVYILEAEVLSVLQEMIRENDTEAGEVQLTGAIERLRQRTTIRGKVIRGQRVDIGTPAGFREGLGLGA